MVCFLIAILALSTVENTKPIEQSVKQHAIYQLVLTWPGDSPNDIDLWSKDPQGRIVGFNRREGGEGSLFSLDHDDLGSRNDMREDGNVIKENKEVINIRGTLQGEYVANAHYYAMSYGTDDLVVPVDVTVTLVKVKPFSEIVSKVIQFQSEGEEHTFFRWSFDDKGNVEDINYLQTNVATLNK